MIGRHLDKYEILEEVGQGGMAVVYKGRDTSLKRDVAIKVLHPHLASHEEARRRFEREAQAVAKLRHENILEIFDYSGKDSAESYIVMEFISGRTLKEFTAAHPIAFPEIAAMIVAELCRALRHAHSLGVLHRDIKPENIMIRDDGVVKLTDFGIAQIIDAQRMTMTGQLLGSPAYMSPEHVEGRPLDFRTDVFSVGILLYQLATGELPFKGKNPHEILKRIAECRFLDPRVVNPLVGQRLGRIIGRALARLPADRYPDVATLCDELAAFLAEAELADPRAELARFFAGPDAYEHELRQLLIDALARRGGEELRAGRVNAALELWNRVLTIEPGHQVVMREIDRLSRRRRLTRGAALALAMLAVGGGVVGATRIWRAPGGTSSGADMPLALGRGDATARAPAAADAPALLETSDAAGAVASPPAGTPTDAASRTAGRDRPDASRRAALLPPDASSLVAHAVKVRPSLGSVVCSVDGGPFESLRSNFVYVTLVGRPVRVVCRHPADIVEEGALVVAPDERAETLRLPLRFRPTRVVARCEGAETIWIDGGVAGGRGKDITEFGENGRRTVEVLFRVGDTTQTQSVTVTAGDATREVRCAP